MQSPSPCSSWSSQRHRIGYALSPKKVQCFIQNSLINQAKQRGIDLIKIGPTKPLTQQGPFDCIIHKLYSSNWNNQLWQLSLSPKRRCNQLSRIHQASPQSNLHARCGYRLENPSRGPNVWGSKSESVG